MRLQLFHRGEPIDLEIDGTGEARSVRAGETTSQIVPVMLGAAAGTLRIDGRPVRFLYERTGSRLRIALGGECFEFDLSGETKKRAAGAHGNPETRAPMPGKVLQVAVEPGREVAPGDPLLILEAMKMENVLCAEIAGTVKEVNVKVGEMVEPGKLLVLVVPKT
jgi:acetyl-CoA/propionyl-CoA carboxylase biotin carboxyl carrier protein